MKKKKVSLNTLEVKKETIVTLGGAASHVVAGLARTTTGNFTREAMCYSATSGYCFPTDNCA